MVDRLTLKVPLSSYSPQFLDPVSPRGSTGLYDAVGLAIEEAKVDVARSQIDTVLFFILTDGHENASRRFSSYAIARMIEELAGDESVVYEFIFMATSVGTLSTARNMGIDIAILYDDKEKGGTTKAFQKASRTMSIIRNIVSSQD